MTHRRQELRDAIVAVIGSGATKTRVRPTQPDELPAVIVYSLREASTLATVKRSLERTVTIVVEVRVAASADLDDAVDAECETIETAMAADPTFGRLAINSWLASTTIGLDGQGDTAQAVASLEYSVIYRTAG